MGSPGTLPGPTKHKPWPTTSWPRVSKLSWEPLLGEFTLSISPLPLLSHAARLPREPRPTPSLGPVTLPCRSFPGCDGVRRRGVQNPRSNQDLGPLPGGFDRRSGFDREFRLFLNLHEYLHSMAAGRAFVKRKLHIRLTNMVPIIPDGSVGDGEPSTWIRIGRHGIARTARQHARTSPCKKGPGRSARALDWGSKLLLVRRAITRSRRRTRSGRRGSRRW